MIRPGRAQQRAELGRLGRGQRHGASDHHELVSAVAAGDGDLEPVDRAEDAADDHVDGVAVLDLQPVAPAAT